MEKSDKLEQRKNKFTDIKIFPVPFPLRANQGNLTINTSTPKQLSKEHIINQAIKFQVQGNILKASKYYEYCLQQDFNDHRVFSNYGVVLEGLGKLKEAERSYRKAIEIKPDLPEAHANLGNILRDLGELQEAEVSTRKAIEINPNFANAHANLGNILRDLGELQEAEVSTRKAIEINPYFAYAHANLGNILRDLGELQEAEVSTRKAIEINPDFAHAHANLGNILRDLGELQEAEVSTRKAIEINPNFAEAYSNLGNILMELGKLQDAELSQRKAIEINPDLAIAHSNLGSILKDLGKFQEAKISYRKAIEINPDLPEAHSNLGNILKDLGKFQEAEISQLKAIEINPDFANAHYNLGNLLKDLGKLKDAEISTSKAIKLNPDFANAHYNLGLLLLHKSDCELSLKYFSKSAELLRGHQNQEPNHKRFTTISKAKIEHDIEQFEYLATKGIETEKFRDLAILYKKVGAEINWPSETELISLSNKHLSLIKLSYNRLIHQIEAPRLKQEAVNNSLDVEKITNNYFNHDFGLTYIDNFLSPTALELLRKFLLGSTIWFDVKKGGYLGAYLKEGLASPLIIQIADELRKKFPKIFQDHPINQIWAYKYDSRAKNENSSVKGINVHADQAAINVNFWITPKEANLNSDSGGLIIYDVEAPKEWDFKTYNNDEQKIREELKNSKGNTKVIPHNENRAVVFNSNLFHETDNYEFKQGYENRRINVTMLFGWRRNA